MGRPKGYNTKQREAVLDFIASLGDSHVTAAQIVENFKNEDVSIGRTTIYRHLDKLAESGKVRKYTIDGISGACYQYIDNGKDCSEHFHLKCEDCGELFHLRCDMLSKVQQHIFDKHIFQVNTSKTVFYGKCEACLHTV